MAAFTSRTVPIRSTSKEAVQFCGVSGIASALTLETTMSRPPSAAALLATQSANAPPSATSSEVPMTLRSGPASASWVDCTASASRAQNATDAPSARSSSTMARPMPRVPPVTSALRPFRCRSM